MTKQYFQTILFLLFCHVLPLTVTAQTVNIPDANLRAMVEKALGKASGDTITVSDMAKLTSLIAINTNISNLTGLEGATNLILLSLRYNSISDLSPLMGLTSLTSLYLDSNSISDLSPVAGLTNLTTLALTDNRISDLSPVAGLTDLTTLALTDNWISDLSPLMGLTSLTSLYLDSNSISDLSPVAGLTNLRSLTLNGNSISDLSPVAGLTDLTTLALTDNSISDLSPVAGLTNLTTLYLQDNSISDMSALLGLTNLTDLRLQDNSISDISALSGLTNLTTLYLSNNNISDISPLVANTGLGSGDTVGLRNNNFLSINHTSIKTHIPTLQSRGVTVEFDDLTHVNIDEYRGDPYTVRLIYFLPNDRPYQADMVQRMKTDIRVTQDFYAAEMQAHGYGNITFRVETDPQGEPMVHRVDGEHPDSHYIGKSPSEISGIVLNEIGQRFDVGLNIYAVLLDNSKGRIGGAGGIGRRKGKNGGTAIVGNNFGRRELAHELGHAFGLQHDFRNDYYMMSYGSRPNQLSACSAEYLAVHPYFNLNVQPEDTAPTVKLISPRIYPAGAENVPIKLKVRDAAGLHQVILSVTTQSLWTAAGFPEVKACQGLGGVTDTVVEFDYDGVTPSDSLTSLSTPTRHPISIEAIDVNGNTRHYGFNLESDSPDVGKEGVIIPDSNLRAKIGAALGKTSEGRISPSEIATLTVLRAGHAGISNLTGLEYTTNLTELRLGSNSISDLSPVSGLTNLTELRLDSNSISDISVLSGLTNLTTLALHDNSISDLSPLAVNTGLGSGDRVHVHKNPLSYISINTHIPILQSKGVTVEFDNRTPTTSLKISGDDQQAAPGASLARPLVVGVQDQRGHAFAGVPVTFAVTAGSGTLSTTTTTTDANGRAESTLTLGSGAVTNTVNASVAGVSETVTFTAIARIEFDLPVPAGISLIHVPLKVTAVDGVAKTLESISDLYDALGGASKVNFLITHDSKTQEWHSYFGPADTGTVVDRTLTDDMGIIAGTIAPGSVRLTGSPLGTDGSSTITLNQGLNLVGLPLRDSRITRVSGLFALEGVGGNVPVIILTDGGDFKAVGRAGDDGDIRVTGGQSFILTAQAAATVAISGDGWYNISGTAAAPLVGNVDLHSTGIQVMDTTPVLALRGSIVDGGTGVNKTGFRVTVKNLSTPVVNREPTSRSAVATVTGAEGVGYQLTIVDIETGRAAMIGDILEVAAQSTNPFIGVHPLRYTVTAKDVKRSLIKLPALATYEIPTETELLANYPNPFNPETWIPYRLAEDAFVTLTIYDLGGRVVRTLDVGHRIAAAYENRSKAIYWDGRNDLAERVASGVYFYTLTAGDYSATRRLVILK